MAFRNGDKVVGLGRGRTVWPSKPVGTVTRVWRDDRSHTWVRVSWDGTVVEDDMRPGDLVPST